MADWTFYDRGFSVFPLWANAKTPLVPEWAAYQTQRAGPEQVAAWSRTAHNLGIATGAVSNCIVLDADDLLARVEADSRGMPDTLTIKTPRGWHFYFLHPGFKVINHVGRSWTRLTPDDPGFAGLDLRGDGGYVVGPGSYYIPTPEELAKGKVEGGYTIELDVPMAPAPDWLLALIAPKAPRAPAPPRMADETTTYGRAALNAEVAVLMAAAPGEVNSQINLSAFAIAQLVGGGEITSEEAWGALEEALAVLGVADEGKANGTLSRGWEAGLLVPRAVDHVPALTPEQILGVRGPTTVDVELRGRPEPRALTMSQGELDDKNNHLAIEYWLTMVGGHTVAYDEFADRILLDGQPITDNTERRAWLATRELSHLKIAKELFGDVLRDIAYANRFHPLRAWLAATEPTWDGVPRIDSWLTTYLGVQPTPLTAAIGAIFLTAAVRRARDPGCKYDELVVLEGPQGIQKSSAVAALSPERSWFSEDFNISMDSKQLLEATHGKWLVEAPELSKLSGAEVEHVKHLLSRQWDRARMAYERAPTERGRQWVGFGTVNGRRYLSDPTGNRRFWPLICGKINVAAIERDRSQIWAEAAQRETAGASIRLDESLWADAAEEQAARVAIDPFAEELTPMLAPFSHGRVRTSCLWAALGIPLDRRVNYGRRFADVMQSMGWEKKRLRDPAANSDLRYWYCKGDDALEIVFDIPTRKLATARPALATI